MKDRKKLLDKLDKLTSEYVRKRDNKCILCGGYVGDWKHLQSHHWIISRAKSLLYRYDPKNCVALCYGCHIHQVHTNPTIALLEELKNKCILNGIATEEEIQRILDSYHTVYKMSISEIEYRIEEMQKKILTL